MARESDVAFMLWDGKSSGTMVNVARMIAAGKPVVLYISSSKKFLTLRTRTDFESLLAASPHEIKAKVHRYIADHAPEFVQPNMF